MPSIKPILLSAALLAGTAIAAHAQYAYYPPPPYSLYAYPPVAAAAPPAAAFYNPYTSGLGPCPQRYPGDPPCSATIQPSYGQPSFWSR